MPAGVGSVPNRRRDAQRHACLHRTFADVQGRGKGEDVKMASHCDSASHRLRHHYHRESQ